MLRWSFRVAHLPRERIPFSFIFRIRMPNLDIFDEERVRTGHRGARKLKGVDAPFRGEERDVSTAGHKLPRGHWIWSSLFPEREKQPFAP